MTFAGYAEKWGRDPSDNYAITCYETMSLNELMLKLPAPSKSDCEQLGLSMREYQDAIMTAMQGWFDVFEASEAGIELDVWAFRNTK